VKSAQQVVIVTIDDQTFAFSPAHGISDLIGDMDYTGLGSKAGCAFFFGELAFLLEPGSAFSGILVVGLPVLLLQ
jgi:hypothetical protein